MVTSSSIAEKSQSDMLKQAARDLGYDCDESKSEDKLRKVVVQKPVLETGE